MRRFFVFLLFLSLAISCSSQTNAAAPAAGYVDVSGGRLYYEECGSGSAVVLLHDGLLHSVVWDEVWPLLCAKHHAVRYDRRGYGRSEAAKAPFSPEDDLLRVMQHVNMERATLMGSSSGTALATDFALAHPERVEALFLIGPVVHGMRSSDYFLQRGNTASAPLAVGDFRAAAENWSKDPFQVNGDRAQARKKIFETLAENPQNFKVPGQFEMRPSPPTVNRLDEVEAPTLLIIGEGDIADVHAFSGAMQAAMPVVRREIWKDVGHLIQLEKPAEVVSRLETFIGLAQRKTVALPATTLQSYQGTYSFFDAPAKIVFKKNHLVLQLNGEADIVLFAESETHFFVRTTGTDLRFEKDASGKTTAMLIRNAGGNPVRCSRLSPP
jgi:3-oxoadipate enol-lactonase